MLSCVPRCAAQRAHSERKYLDPGHLPNLRGRSIEASTFPLNLYLRTLLKFCVVEVCQATPNVETCDFFFGGKVLRLMPVHIHMSTTTSKRGSRTVKNHLSFEGIEGTFVRNSNILPSYYSILLLLIKHPFCDISNIKYG